MYSSAYNKLFWGFIFVILKINIGPLDILPDFLGYFIMYSGICDLSVQNIYYAKAKWPSVVLAIISFKDLVINADNNLLTGNTGNFQIGNPWLGIIGAVTMVINIYLIYIICNGICLVSEEKDLIELNGAASWRLKFYFVISIVYAFIIPFTMNLPRDFSGILILLVIPYFIVMIAIAALFRKARAQLSD